MQTIPYRAIAESTYDWETWIDATGAVRWVSPTVERLTGYSASECMAMEDFPQALVHEEDRARFAEVLALGAAGHAGNDVEFRVRRKDGTLSWGAISWQSLHDEQGEARGFRTSVRDIDARKRAEERIKDAERVATERSREQAELLATLSHELRTPLHCISGFGELIERCELSPEVRKHVAIVREQSDAALRLVEDLLHFVSFGQAPAALRTRAFDLAGLVAREVTAARPRLRSGVSLVCDVAEDAHGVRIGDPDRVRQIVANLLSNAARFTERGAVEVFVRAHEDAVTLEVKDTGIGMSGGLLERVREPFVQGAPSASSRGGVGLGLAIVDRLVGAMGGTLTLSSTFGAGTRACVALPLPRAIDERVEHETAGVLEAPNLASLRVLVVDDIEPARELLAAMFRTLHANVTTASGGRDAIERVRASTYDLVVLDYHMPDLDGISTARHIRSLAAEGVRGPRLVLLTANVLADAFGDPTAHGVDLVLAKPLRLADIATLATRAGTANPVPAALEPRQREVTGRALDLEVARELAAVRGPDGKTLLARTLPRVEAYAVTLVDRIRDTLHEPSLHAGLADEVHALKGLTASIGAREASEQAAKLEEALRAGRSAPELARALEAFVHAYASAHARLGRLVLP